MTNKDKGNKLENYVADYIKELDPKARPTKGSGAHSEVGDILSKQFYIECKKRDTNSITIKDTVWDKLCNEVPLGSLKIPLYILENIKEQRWVVLDFKDFMSIIRRAYE